jgi:hypothetical protein
MMPYRVISANVGCPDMVGDRGGRLWSVPGCYDFYSTARHVAKLLAERGIGAQVENGEGKAIYRNSVQRESIKRRGWA